MEHEGSLPHSQEPATCPYPQLSTEVYTSKRSDWNINIFLTLLFLPENKDSYYDRMQRKGEF